MTTVNSVSLSPEQKCKKEIECYLKIQKLDFEDDPSFDGRTIVQVFPFFLLLLVNICVSVPPVHVQKEHLVAQEI